MNKAQHPTAGIAKHSTSHQIPHYTIHITLWSGGTKCVWCEMYGVLCRKCGPMWNTELWWWDTECITLPLHLAPHHVTTPFYIASFHKHHLWHYSEPHHSPHHTIIPHRVAHFISHQHLSQHTISLCTTIFQIAPYVSHVHHPTDVSHCTPFHITGVPYNATFHVLHVTLISHHILATSFVHRTTTPRTTFYTTLHRISHAEHLASFHHIWPWLHPIPHPTTMLHVTFHITHRYITTFYIPPLITSRITPPPLPRIAPCHSPHSTSFHIAHSTFHATEHAPGHITPPLSITPFQLERSGTICDPFFIHVQPFIPYRTQQKNGGKKSATLFIKCQKQ